MKGMRADLEEKVGLGVGVVGGAGVDLVAHCLGEGQIQLVLIVPHRHLIVLCHSTQQPQHLQCNASWDLYGDLQQRVLMRKGRFDGRNVLAQTEHFHGIKRVTQHRVKIKGWEFSTSTDSSDLGFWTVSLILISPQQAFPNEPQGAYCQSSRVKKNPRRKTDLLNGHTRLEVLGEDGQSLVLQVVEGGDAAHSE